MKTAFPIQPIVAFAFLFFRIHPACAQNASLGQFDSHGDIGAPAISGSAVYVPTNQTYILTGAGANIWSTNDQFHFLWKKINGDFIVRGRVEFVGKGVEEHRKVGW